MEVAVKGALTMRRKASVRVTSCSATTAAPSTSTRMRPVGAPAPVSPRSFSKYWMVYALPASRPVTVCERVPPRWMKPTWAPSGMGRPLRKGPLASLLPLSWVVLPQPLTRP